MSEIMDFIKASEKEDFPKAFKKALKKIDIYKLTDIEFYINTTLKVNGETKQTPIEVYELFIDTFKIIANKKVKKLVKKMSKLNRINLSEIKFVYENMDYDFNQEFIKIGENNYSEIMVILKVTFGVLTNHTTRSIKPAVKLAYIQDFN